MILNHLTLEMNQTEDRAKLRIHVSNDLQEWVYPRGAVIMVAGIGGGDNFRFVF